MVEAKKIIEVIRERLMVSEKTEINEDTRLIEDLGADSLDLVDLVMALEEEFDIEIPDEDAEKIFTVREVIDYVQEKAR